jgi:hypothetical protein
MKRTIILALTLLMALTSVAKPKSNHFEKGRGKVYLFGVCQQLTDSMVYITSIQEVDSVDLEKKTKFLPFRSEFSIQLKEYMEGSLQRRYQTACVFYSAKRKKISKKFYKIKKRYLDNPYTRVMILDEASFRFKHPLDSFSHDK